ncbi:hypothetical protein B0I35DRAFT_428350 [Stachybotrys elegans]|uniref:Secreted protein n=1 Tax=Stachybotrys elegans TaxID=80388 RepID=A0A8K0SQ51_9HYPO|nr:hypothetical protein B0I35DRAFT_428350 [Stachybotrys elegans]
MHCATVASTYFTLLLVLCQRQMMRCLEAGSRLVNTAVPWSPSSPCNLICALHIAYYLTFPSRKDNVVKTCLLNASISCKQSCQYMVGLSLVVSTYLYLHATLGESCVYLLSCETCQYRTCNCLCT